MDPISAIIKIINFIQDVIGKSDLLPNFAIEELFTPDSIAQNLTFVLKVSNKSSKSYSIDR
jgi:hypothetical protein